MSAVADTMFFRAEGKVALITGAGSGINLEFASILASRQCKVLIVDLALRPEAQALIDSFPDGRVKFHKTDVTDWTQLSAAFDACISHFGSLDIVCPGAGVFEPPWSAFFQPPGSGKTLSRDTATGRGHYAQLDINLTHPIRATQLALSHFLNPSHGAIGSSSAHPRRIVHCASIAGEVGSFGAPIYSASKWAICGFVRSLASLDALLGVRVNAVAPGLVKTPLFTENADKMAWMDADVVERNWIEPREVAEAMVRLMEDEELVGGSILEVGRGVTRVVPMLNNPGPSGPGMEGVDRENAQAQVLEWLQQDNWGK